MTQLICLDESYNPDTKLASLTGIGIPLDNFKNIRETFYSKILDRFIYEKNGIINLKLPELHANKLLNNTIYSKDDSLKLEIFRHCIDLVNEHQLRIYRVVWLRTKSIKVFKNLDDKLLDLVFPKFIKLLEPTLKDNSIILIMDGLDDRISKIFSQYIKSCEIVRRIGKNSSLESRFTDNIIGEVFYADSKYSSFTQLADLISYILQCSDYKNFKKSTTDFKDKIIDIAKLLNSDLINQIYHYLNNK